MLQGIDFGVIWAEYRYMGNKFTLTILLMMSASSVVLAGGNGIKSAVE